MNSQEIESLVLHVVTEINPELPDDQRLDADPNAALFGEGSRLDSLGFVTLILAVEDALADRTGTSLSLVDDRALSRASSPFRTIATLSAYIAERLASDG